MKAIHCDQQIYYCYKEHSTFAHCIKTISFTLFASNDKRIIAFQLVVRTGGLCCWHIVFGSNEFNDTIYPMLLLYLPLLYRKPPTS